MKDLVVFFYAIGIYNIIGGGLMFLLLNEKIAERLFTPCEIFTAPYKLGNAGQLWLWWAAIFNSLYGILNIAARRWDVIAQHDLMLGNILLYAVFLILTLVGIRSKTYARGLYFNLPLFGFWLVWGVVVYFENF